MKKEIRQVDEKKGIVQITTVDERWYIKPTNEPITGLPAYQCVPSSTWIASYYPKGISFLKWLADKGWDESERIKSEAGDKGSRVHQAISELILGNTVKMDGVYPGTDGIEKELSLEEFRAVISFADWAAEIKPKFIKNEFCVFNDKYGYAGMVDLLVEIQGKIYVIDLKTSQYIWPSHRLQISSYKNALQGNKYQEINLAILQIGYTRNKDYYKFTEIEDCFDLFLATKTIWAAENHDVKPKQIELPLEIKL